MRHQSALDGIRAIAVMIVIASHAGLSHMVPGDFGVTLFFFLSGYLITSLMRDENERSGSVSLHKFYLRRVFRIFPPLYITMALVTLLGVVGMIPMLAGPNGWLSDALFLTNYAYLWTKELGLNLPLWSLDVEEHFYLLFPLFYIFVLRPRRPIIGVAIIAGVCLLELMIRLYNVATISDILQNKYWTHTRIDSILFGSALALWQNPALDGDAWQPKPWHILVAMIGLLSTFVIRDEGFRQTFRHTIQGVTLFVMFSVILQNRGRLNAFLSSWPLKWIGLYSYTLYLCHVPAFQIVRHYWPNASEPLVGVIGSLLALGYAAVMYEAIEKPVARWRRSLHIKAGAVPAEAI